MASINDCLSSQKEIFNCLRATWPKGYMRGSLGESDQNGDYLIRKVILQQDSNLQSLDFRSTALPIELERKCSRMLNFGYLNPATCTFYDVNNNLFVMFLTFAGPEILTFNCLGAIWPKGYKCRSLEKSHQNDDYLKQAIRNSCPLTGFQPAVFM